MLCTSPQLHFKLNAIHGHATWKHQSPFPLKIKIEKKNAVAKSPDSLADSVYYGVGASWQQ